MVSNRRSISKFLLVIATVAVVILYLEFNQNSLKFRNGVKNYIPISAWATEKEDLVQRTILYQQNKDMIECRGRNRRLSEISLAVTRKGGTRIAMSVTLVSIFPILHYKPTMDLRPSSFTQKIRIW